MVHIFLYECLVYRLFGLEKFFDLFSCPKKFSIHYKGFCISSFNVRRLMIVCVYDLLLLIHKFIKKIERNLLPQSTLLREISEECSPWILLGRVDHGDLSPIINRNEKIYHGISTLILLLHRIFNTYCNYLC